MICFSRFSLMLFLLFLQQQNSTSRSFIPQMNINRADEFIECIFQNIAKSSYFSQNDKQNIISTILNAENSSLEINKSHSQRRNIDLAFFVSELALGNEETFSSVSMKTKSMFHILQLCFQTTPITKNQIFISEVNDLTNRFPEQTAAESKANTIDASNDIQLVNKIHNYSRVFFLHNSTESAPDSVSFTDSQIGKLRFSTLENYKTDMSSGDSLPSETLLALTNNFAYALALSDEFQSIFNFDISTDARVRIIFSALATSLSSMSIPPSVFNGIRHTLDYTIFNIEDKRSILSYAQIISSSVISEMSSFKLLTADNVHEIVPKFFYEHLKALSFVITQYRIAISSDQTFAPTTLESTTENSAKPVIDFYPTRKTAYDFISTAEDRRHVRVKRESITIDEHDLQKCANTVKFYFENELKMSRDCNKIFERGVWDDKYDKTLDRDTSRLIHLIYDGKKENLQTVLDFIDKRIPHHVRELIVSYDAIITEYGKSEDFNSLMFQQNFHRIKAVVINIKNMNGDHPADDYKFALERHQTMLDNILEYIRNIEKIAESKSISITYMDLVNCADSVKVHLEDEVQVRKSCIKIFHRGVWDKKADVTLDRDIKTLIELIIDSKSENLIKVLYFIENYVPHYVRELVVSYDAIIDEFEKTEDFQMQSNRWYLWHIRKYVAKIENMTGVTLAFNYSSAKQMHKDMFENIMIKLNLFLETGYFSNENEDIKNCANSVKDNIESELACYKIFNKTVSDRNIDKVLHNDIKTVIHIIYDRKNKNILKVLDFIDKYVPKYARELIFSYDAIIYEFVQHEDFDLEVNQQYIQRIRAAVEDIKKINNNVMVKNYELLHQTYKDMLENILEILNVLTKNESVFAVNRDIQNCASLFRISLKNNSGVLASCFKIFNIREEKANGNFDANIKKLIELLYDNKRENLLNVLYFIDMYVPRHVRELIVSYYAFMNAFGKHEKFNHPLNQWYFLQIRQDVREIKNMNNERQEEIYELSQQIYRDMAEEILEKLSVIGETESISITSLDIQNCAAAVKVNLENKSEIIALCSKIFQRGVWDGKADGTLDNDIRKLIQIIYDSKRDNFEKVFDFIDTYVPKYVRELIISYDTLIKEFEKNDDLKQPINEQYLQQIKKAVTDIKHMTGEHPAEKYELALQTHKLILEDILRKITDILPKESITIEHVDLQNCAHSIQANLYNHKEMFEACNKIFVRGVWDEKVDRTLDNDINKLIQLSFDGKIENLVNILYFVEKYVPKYVRELIVCFSAIVNEFERKKDINLQLYQHYFQKIKKEAMFIKSLNGDQPHKIYTYAHQSYKAMLENILKRMDEMIEGSSALIGDQYIEKCAQTVKVRFDNEFNIFTSCSGIFNTNSSDEKVSGTLDRNVRKLMHLIYDHKRENLVKVLYFIDKYLPKNVRVLIISYDVIIDEFQKEDFSLPINQPYFQQIQNAVTELKTTTNKDDSENYELVPQAYKTILENILANLNAVSEKQSISVGNYYIQNCANTVEINLSNEPEVHAYCCKIFNRGFWDEKADRTLDRDIKQLIHHIYNDKRENLIKVLNFIDKYVPKHVRELSVSYDAIFKVFELREHFNLQIYAPAFQRIRKAIADIKNMNGEHLDTNYHLAKQIYKDMLENILEILNQFTDDKSRSVSYEDIVNCANLVKVYLKNESDMLLPCNKIFNRVIWDENADTMFDRDVIELIHLIYSEKRENIANVLYFIDHYVPQHVRELIVSYHAIIYEIEKTKDFDFTKNQPYLLQIYKATARIKDMNGEHVSDKFNEAQSTHKDMLRNILEKLNAIKAAIPSTKETIIQNCIQAIQEATTNAEDICNEVLKKENNREWFPSDVLWLESDVEIIVRESYDGERKYFANILRFVRHKFPYIEQIVKGYKILFNEMERYQIFDQTELSEFITKVNESLNDNLKNTEDTALLTSILNILNTHFESLKQNLIHNCVNAIQREDFIEADELCNQILKKEDNRVWVSGRDYDQNDVKEIVLKALGSKLQYLEIVLKFVTEEFPYNSQAVLGYSTLIEEIMVHKQLDLKILNTLLQKIKSSVTPSLWPLNTDTKSEYQTLINHLESLTENRQDELIEVFINAIHSGSFTEEENEQWKQLYGGETGFKITCITCSSIEKLVVLIYDGNHSNFDAALKIIDKFYFPDQKIESWHTLLKELENARAGDKEALKVIENNLKEIEINDLSEDYKKTFVTLKQKLNSLLHNKSGNKNDVQECNRAIKNKNWTQVKIQCNKVLLGINNENSNDSFPERDTLEYIVITAYGKNLENVSHVLELINKFPYIHQRLEGYEILLTGVKEKEKYPLYFSSLNQLKEKLKSIIYSEYYKYLRPEDQEHVEMLRKHLKELIARYIKLKGKYIAPKESLKHLNETLISIDNIHIKITTYYDIPPYFADYSFQNELRDIYKEAREVIKNCKDFVLPESWRSGSNTALFNVWIFNDPDIFEHRDGFTRLDGIYLHRNKKKGGLVKQFRHEFMHALIIKGIERLNFMSSIPRWFHEGLAELSQHGVCNPKQLNLLKHYVNVKDFEKMRNLFFEMIQLTAEKQKIEYPSNYILNCFLPYFAVSFLRMQHPEFLKQIIHETYKNGWESSNVGSTDNMSASSVKEKVYDLFNNERDTFSVWMEKSSQNYSFCYSNQPSGKYEMASDFKISRIRRDHTISQSVHTDGKFSWQNLINAFEKKDAELIEREIEHYHATLKKLIENLNLLPFTKHLEQQKPFMDIVHRFLDEIHSRRDELSIGYYYYYANSCLKLVFEDLILPIYQRASFENEKAASFKYDIQLLFEQFLIEAFSKELPPDYNAFLRWYRVRCQDIGFCTPRELAITSKMLSNLAGKGEDVEVK